MGRIIAFQRVEMKFGNRLQQVDQYIALLCVSKIAEHSTHTMFELRLVDEAVEKLLDHRIYNKLA